MPKLTNYMRKCIAKDAISFVFDSKLEAFKLAEDKLAREAHAFIFSAKEIALVMAAPENWVCRTPRLQFNVGGQRITLSTIGEALPVPYKNRGSDYAGYGCRDYGVIPPGDLCVRIQRHAQDLEGYRDQRRTAEQQLIATLNSVTTTNKLKEVWPEGLQFFAKYEASPPPSLPAIRFEEINSLLGLSEAAA